jgi:nitrogen fixation/metabolism regulation signal transduction histidine kinase
MILPSPELAIIGEDKLAGYSLNLEHSEGKHKARVFKSALNMDASDAEELRQALLEVLKNYDAIPSKSNAYGQKYIIDFPLSREGKSATICSVWIIRNGEDFARLITCYVI